MTTSIDKRVAEMNFDNVQFERAVKTSLDTLSRLKDGLKLENAGEGFKALSEHLKNFSLVSIANGVQNISGKFSAMGAVAFNVITSLSNRLFKFAEEVYNKLMVPMQTGFAEYETQMNAIQTVMANTASKGTTLEDVSDALDVLNEYADRTIYNFTEMTRNIGTFTAAGVSLETSTAAIKGIANLAAVSGSNSQQASTAMYQLSQALASGTVKLMDWNSVVNAGMGGQVFQDALKETARVQGIAIDDIIESNGSFRESLQEGWLTSEVLLATLSKFTGDLTEAELIAMGYAEDEIAAIIELGQVANNAATEVKTLSQLQSTLSEAMQSGWTQSWELVIGDFEEAKSFFTELSDTIGGLISTDAAARNKILRDWKKFGGRIILIDAVHKAFEALGSILGPIKEAFKDIFPPITGYQLRLITGAIRDLIAKFILTEEKGEAVKKIFTAIFGILKFLINIVLAVGKGILSLFKLIPINGSQVLDFFVRLAERVTEFLETFNVGDKIAAFFERLGAGIVRTLIWLTSKTREAIAAIVEFKNKVVEFIRGIDWSPLINAFNAVKAFFINLVEDIDIRKRIQDVWNFLKGLVTKISIFIDSLDLSGPLGSIWIILQAIGAGISGIFTSIANFINGLTSTVTDGATSKLEGLKLFIGGIIDWFRDLFEKIDIGGMIENIDVGAIGEKLSSIDFTKIFQAIGLGLGGVLTFSFVDFLKDLSGVAETANDILDSLTGVLDGVRGALEAWQTTLKAEALMKIAIAVAILTVAIIALSLVDPVKLAIAVGTITTLFLELTASFGIMAKLPGGSNGQLAATILAISLSMLVLAFALTVLAKIDSDTLGRGLVAAEALIIPIISYSKVLSNVDDRLRGSAITIGLLALSLMVLSVALKMLGQIDSAQVSQGLKAMGVSLLIIVIFYKMLPKEGDLVRASASITVLALSLMVLSLALRTLGAIPVEQVQQGLLVMGIALAVIVAAYQNMPNETDLIKAAASIAIVAASMIIMSLAVKAFGAMDQAELQNGLLAIGALMGGLVAMFNYLPDDTTKQAAGILLAALALTILAGAVYILGNMDQEQLLNGMLALGVAMVILAVGMEHIKGSIAGAAAMILISIALGLLVPTLMLLGEMDLKSLGIALLAMAGIFLIFGLAGLLLKPLIPVLLMLGVAMLLFALATTLIGVAMLKFAVALGLISVLGAGVGAVITLIVMTLLNLIPQIATAIVAGIGAFFTALAENAPTMIQAIVIILISLLTAIDELIPPLLQTLGKLITAVLEFLLTYVPDIVNAALALITELLQGIATALPDIIQAGYDIILAFLQGISDNVEEVVAVVGEIIVKYLEAVAAELPDIIQAGFELLIAFIDGIASAIEENGPDLNDAISRLATAIVQGLVDGITNGIGAIVDAVGELAGAALQALKDLLGIESPSTETTEAGMFFSSGFLNGIVALSGKIKDAVVGVGKKAITGLSNAISGITKVVNDEMNVSPVIRPVVDLSDVESSGKLVGGLLGGAGIDVGATLSRATDAANGMSGIPIGGTASTPAATSVTFNQNNYSPEALSQLDIYRQTRRQLLSLKGVLP